MLELKLFVQSLSPITDATWEEVQKVFTAALLKKGALFCEEGKVARDFAFLRTGIVRGFYRKEQGSEYIKQFFIPNSIIGGYTSLITGKPNFIIQEALTDCSIWIANYAAFVNLYNTHPDLERVGRVFAERYFVEKERKELNIILYDAEKRYELFKIQFPQMEQLIPQYHIASYLGISATQLSRIRKKLSRS